MSVTIVLDTNAVFDDPALRGASIGRLLAMSRRDLVRLVVPQVVLGELRRQRRTVVADQVRILEVMPTKAMKALKELGVSPAELGMIAPVVPHLDVKDMLSAHDREVERRLRENSVMIAPLPDVPVPDIYERDLAARRPFDAQGKGFRDALIWGTVVRLCSELDPDDTVYLVTNDKNFEADGIAPELRSEIPVGAAALHHSRDLDGLLERGDLSERSLMIQQIVESLGRAPIETAWYSAERGVSSTLGDLSNYSLDVNEQQQVGVPDELYAVTITDIADVRDFSWNAYDECDNTTVLGQASVTGSLHLEGTCSAEDVEDLQWYDDADDFEVDTEDDLHCSVQLTREAVLFFDVRVELSSDSAEQVDFEGFQPA